MTLTRHGAATAPKGQPCIGPLASHVEGFAAQLSRKGYAPNTVRAKCGVLADLSRWLERRQLALAALDEARLKQFQVTRRRRDKGRRGDLATGQQLLEYLRERDDIAAATQKVDRTAAACLTRDFEEFLHSERGLSRSTMVSYLPIVRSFLDERFGRKALRFEQLRAQDLHGFILREIQRVSRSHGKGVVTALRSFLRFLLQRGAIQTDLARTLPGVATWRLSHLPKSLPPEQVERLLVRCDRSTPTGKRDYAILLLLARLGLRGGEVLGMTLDDLDWERGEIVVRGKGQRLERLPLPADVGEALACYLIDVRPAGATRRVFIRMKAPRRELAGPVAICCIDLAEREGAAYITTELALAWATQPAAAQPAQWANRLGMLRRFALYCSVNDSRTTVPASDLLPHRYHRPDPYLYRDEEITRLLEAARRLPSATGLRPHTFATLFGLYAATGLRANEPLRLDRDDVDLVNGVLTIRDTKFGKSRYVPLHCTTQRALQRYAARRDRCCDDLETPSFFVSDRGTRLTEWCVRWTFVKLSHEIGLRGAGDSRGPRLHDLRHRLAITTLLKWYQRGVDVERHLPELSTYLGHAHITDTYWYLTATPKLLHYALRRVERSRQGPRP